MREFFNEDIILYMTWLLITNIATGAFTYYVEAENHSLEKERIFKCLKNDKCLEYIKKHETAPSKELLEYLTNN